MLSKDRVKVEVKELPELQVAYIRHVGPYQGISQAFERLFRWAGPRGLIRFPQTKSLAVYHDNPEITEADKLRSSACLTVPAGTKGEGEIGTMTIPGGLFAVAHTEIAPDEFGQAWTALMGGWLPESGYQPDDRLCYEVYLNDPKQHPEGKFIIEICEPVKPCRTAGRRRARQAPPRANRGCGLIVLPSGTGSRQIRRAIGGLRPGPRPASPAALGRREAVLDVARILRNTRSSGGGLSPDYPNKPRSIQ
jgi:DNA gyrase inhibitor GyrI